MSEEDSHQDTFNKKYLVNHNFDYVLPGTEDVAEDTMNVHRYIGTYGYIETPTYPDMPRTGTIWFKLVIPDFDSSVWKLNFYTDEGAHKYGDEGHHKEKAEDFEYVNVNSSVTAVTDTIQIQLQKRTMDQITEDEIASFADAYIVFSDTEEGLPS